MPRANGQTKQITNGHKTKLANKLAQPGDPLVMRDGKQIRDKSRDRVVRSEFESSEFRPFKRRSIKDLPAPPSVFNGIAAIFVYTVLGLSDREIADILGVHPEMVQYQREQSSYDEAFRAILDEFISSDSEIFHGRLAAMAHGALDKADQLMEESESDIVQLKAAEVILDQNAQAKEFQRGQSNNDLRITIIEGDKEIAVRMDLGRAQK